MGQILQFGSRELPEKVIDAAIQEQILATNHRIEGKKWYHERISIHRCCSKNHIIELNDRPVEYVWRYTLVGQERYVVIAMFPIRYAILSTIQDFIVPIDLIGNRSYLFQTYSTIGTIQKCLRIGHIEEITL